MIAAGPNSIFYVAGLGYIFKWDQTLFFHTFFTRRKSGSIALSRVGLQPEEWGVWVKWWISMAMLVDWRVHLVHPKF